MSENPSNDSPPTSVVSAGGTLDRHNHTSELDAEAVMSPSGSGRLLAWLALLLAAVALAGVGILYYFVDKGATAPDPHIEQIARLGVVLDNTRQTIDAQQATVGELAARTDAQSRQLQAIEERIYERLQQVDSLPPRIRALEGSVASLRGISSGLLDAWLLAEAEYYMQIANAQLQLADNPELARLALQLADEKIQQLANPALTDVRRALANELRALDAIDSPDIEGIALTLSSLATVVDGLPLNQEIETPQANASEIDPELSGIDRMFASLRRTANEIVSVRRSDEAVRPLIAPEAQYFLRANLSLQLQAARIALLRGEQPLFDQSLDDAANWLNDYYDLDSTAVRSALETISEARLLIAPVTLPDISESLRLLRQHRVLSDAETGGPTAEPVGDDGNAQ
jgi:uroporphyrin-3 C-methyltransferase